MKWTHTNIAAFGGDPKRIFIVGQSAGANSVSQHLVRPKSWPYFAAAGMESGAFYDGLSTATTKSQVQSWKQLVKFLNCSNPTSTSHSDVDCVVHAPKLALVDANKKIGGWSITVDGVDLVAPGPVLASRGHLANVPIFAGAGGAHWPQYDAESGVTMVFDDKAAAEPGLRAVKCDAWDVEFEQLLKSYRQDSN